MPKKSISEMNLFERLHHSLGGKTFRAIVIFGLVLSIASVGFGFFLYASSVRRDFRNRAWQMARTAARVIDMEEAVNEAGLVAYYFLTASEEQHLLPFHGSTTSGPKHSKRSVTRFSTYRRAAAASAHLPVSSIRIRTAGSSSQTLIRPTASVLPAAGITIRKKI